MSDMEPPMDPALQLDAPRPQANLKARILAAAAAQPPATPPRKRWFWQSLTLVAASWAVALGVFAFAGGIRPTGRATSLMVGTASGTALVAALFGWLLLTRGSSSLGRARGALLPVIIGAVPAILVWKVLWSMQYPGGLEQWETRPGLRCLALTLAIALCPLVAFVAVRRGSDPRHPALTGLAAGVGVGAIATLCTDLWCPVAFVPHLLLGHALPVALLGGLGALLGNLFIRLR